MTAPTPAALITAATAAAASATTVADLADRKRHHLGKTSRLKAALSGLRHLPKADRPAVAKALNAARSQITALFAAAEERVRAAERQARLDAEWMDLSLPGDAPRRGARHPVRIVERRCLAVMRQLGFELVEGPEVEAELYNFDALNIPKHHPARDMQDTFYVGTPDGQGESLLLRSHTTTVQARILESRPALPIKVASAGRVYRNEAVDATHTAMFHQLEGFWVEPGLTFAHLKGILRFVAEGIYGPGQVFRFKPKFYPYTEPSLGLDIRCTSCHGNGCGACHGAGWVTIIGSGMIHPNVFTRFGYDPAEVSGIAFGWGTTRMTAQWVGLDRARSLYEQDLRLYKAIHRGHPGDQP